MRYILNQAPMRNGFHRRRCGAAVVLEFQNFSAKEVTLLTVGLPMRSRTREISHRRRRDAAVVLGHAFDFWSTARNLKASPHEGEFARATRRGAALVFGVKEVTLLTFGLPRAVLKRELERGRVRTSNAVAPKLRISSQPQ